MNEKMGSERRENIELLTESQKLRQKVGVDGTARSRVDHQPPPLGRIRPYTVALASFLVNGLIFGIINSYSIIFVELKDRLEGVKNAEVKASLAGSLTIGTTFALSPLSGVLTNFVGLRMTAVIGGFIATAGMLLTSFVVNNVDALCFTYGIMFGVGASLVYIPSLAILGQYFTKYLGIVNGVVTVGSSLFTVFIPMLMEPMIKNHGLEWTFRLLSLFTVGLIFCGLLFEPVPVLVTDKPLKEDKSFDTLLKTICSVKMWKIMKYRLWALSMPVALFGYFVPYVHIKEFMKSKFVNLNFNLPLQCIAVTSALGRISFGLLADVKWVDRIFLQQISFYVIGTLTILLPFVPSFGYVIAIALGMGLFEGGFIALIGPIAFDLVGTGYAAQAIGCMLGLAAIPLSIGPSIAGAIHSSTGDYTLPFILAGLSPLAGATVMFLIRCVKSRDTQVSDTNGHAVTINEPDLEKAPALANGQARL